MKSKTYKPVVLIILDGWGLAPPGPGNAIELAKTPFFDHIWSTCPRTQLKASGKAVGLPEGEVGTSEVGHLNIGAGRVIWQGVSKINYAIKDKSFFKNPAFLKACQRAKENKARLHLMGLVGGGTVHSSIKHLFALSELCAQEGLTKEMVKIHIFTDGRDSPPRSALTYILQLQKKMQELGVGKIASVTGRYYAMDRDRRWERTELAYDALTLGEGETTSSAEEAIEKAYARGETDEFIKPTLIQGLAKEKCPNSPGPGPGREGPGPFPSGAEKEGPSRTLGNSDSEELPAWEGLVKDGDSIIFFNFRADRARQLTKAFVLPKFQYFKRSSHLRDLFFVNLVECEKGIPVSASAFTPHHIKANLAQIISQQGKTQFHIAESEKYAYATYYFNGGIEPPFAGEDRLVIPSPKVSTYDQAPEMSAVVIANEVQKRTARNSYNFILINFANPDMLGHTGIVSAAIKGIEATDTALKKVVGNFIGKGGVCLITADHGNAEEMIDPVTGEVSTSHSNNRVPFIVAGPREDFKPKELQSGILADIAPTVLKLMGIPKPSLMTGKSLI